MFKKYETYKPEISDHKMIYKELTEKVRKRKTKMITFRQTKNIDIKELNRDLNDAPWPVGDIFGNSNEKYDYGIILINRGQKRTHKKEIKQ